MSTQTAPVEAGSPEAQAHIAANTRLQEVAAAAAAAAWLGLGSYDEEDVPRFLSLVVPVVLAAQRASVALTVAYLARAIGRTPAPVDVDSLIGASIRSATPPVIEAADRAGVALTPESGVPPEIVYRRPFIGVWSDLGKRMPWEQAVDAGRARVEGLAAMDVQNSMRHTLRLVGGTEDLILGYRRVPDANACPFCKLIAGRRYHTWDLMEVHTRCKCGVDVVTQSNRDEFFGKRENDIPQRVTADGITAAVEQHGELGPLLVDGSDGFKSLDSLAA